MGVKGLAKLLKKYAPDSIVETHIKTYRKKVMMVDTSLIVYQHMIALRSRGEDLVDDSGKITSHVHAVLGKAGMLLKLEILPVFVFDGEPPKIKTRTLEYREGLKQKATTKLEQLEEHDKEGKIKEFKKLVEFTPKQVKECKILLTYMGIPFIQAPSEADPQCAKLAKDDKAYGVISEDMDLLAFGTPILIRELSSKKKKTKEIHLKKVLEGLKFTQEQLIDLCILLGSDYSPTIKGVGPKTAYEIIKKFGSIAKFLKWNDKSKKKKDISDEFLKSYKKARDYFLDAPVKNIKKEKLIWKKPSSKRLYKFLVKMAFNPELALKRVKLLSAMWKLENAPPDNSLSLLLKK